jgi:hypothetical protein
MSLSLPGTIVFDVVLVVLVVLVARRAPKVWRNEIGYSSDDPPARWRWGLASWRGYQRTTAGVFPLIWCPGALLVVASTISGPAWVQSLVAVLALVPGAVFVIGLPAVWLFNRPKWLVAPHLRHQPGAIAEFFGAHVAPTPPPERPPPFQPWLTR